MIFNNLFHQFIDQSPICVMVRAVLERVFSNENIDQVFERTAQKQYTRELLFSTLVSLMTQVVFKISPSVRAAYQAAKKGMTVSITSVYNKLNGVETHVAATLVRECALQLEPIIRQMKGMASPLLPGYRIKYLDGNHLSGTQHRIEELRFERAGALPGFALAILDQALMLITNVILCEDGHAQERSLLDRVLDIVKKLDLIIADRNFCTTKFLFGIHLRDAFFVIRQHATNLRWRKIGRRRMVGVIETGRVYEQTVELTDPETGKTMRARRITVELYEPTRDGDKQIHILTNLPETDADGCKVAELYRTRWTIETGFQEITETLNCEIDTLGYPQAALFAFCLALMAYNAVSVIKAAMRVAHGEQTVKDEVSAYYMTLEVTQTYTGMMIALPADQWVVFGEMSNREFAEFLVKIAKGVYLPKYQKHVRGPKKPPPEKRSGAKIKHLSTARILAQRKEKTKQKISEKTPEKAP